MLLRTIFLFNSLFHFALSWAFSPNLRLPIFPFSVVLTLVTIDSLKIFLLLFQSLFSDHGNRTLGDTESRNHDVHGSISGDFLHGCCFGSCNLLCGFWVVWIIWPRQLWEAQGDGGACGASAAASSGRRDNRGGAETVWWVWYQEASAHGYQESDLWCFAKQATCFSSIVYYLLFVFIIWVLILASDFFCSFEERFDFWGSVIFVTSVW